MVIAWTSRCTDTTPPRGALISGNRRPRHRVIPCQLIGQQRHQHRPHQSIEILSCQAGAQRQVQREDFGRAARHQPQQPRRRAGLAELRERQRPGGGDPLVIPGRIPRPSSSARRARNNPRYPAMLRPEACMYAPACSSASGSPPSSPASSNAAASSPGPAAPVRFSKNPAATARSSTGTSSTRRPGQDPNWLVITTRPPQASGPSPATTTGSGTLFEHQQPVIPTGPAPHVPAPPHLRPRRPSARPARRTPPPARPGPRPATATPPRTGPPAGGRTPPRAGLARTPQPGQHHHPPALPPVRPPAGPPGTPASSSSRPARYVGRCAHRRPATPAAPSRPGPAARPTGACCKVVNAWDSSISSRSGESTGCTVIPASRTRSRNARCRSPCTGSDKNTCGSCRTAFSSSTNTSCGRPSSPA